MLRVLLRMAAHNGQVEMGKTVNKDELYSEDLRAANAHNLRKT